MPQRGHLSGPLPFSSCSRKSTVNRSTKRAVKFAPDHTHSAAAECPVGDSRTKNLTAEIFPKHFLRSALIAYANTCHVVCFAVKIGPSDPKSRLRDISREVAQKAGELRGVHPSRRELDRGGPRRPESRYRGTDG